LASLLLPVLENAKESATQIKCLNQIKQCMIATLAYSFDYNGYIPPECENPYNLPGNIYPESRWGSFLICLDYLPQLQVIHCPNDFEASLNANSNVDVTPAHTAIFSYGRFSSLGDWYRTSTTKNPAGKLIYADSIYFYTYGGYNQWCHSSSIATTGYTLTDTNRTVHLRHINSGNAAFADGHARGLVAEGFVEYGVLGGRDKYYYPIYF
jgi:prepilin-type processing-associated H-X9-DG protein